MNIEKIKNAKTKYLGKNIIYFPQMPSTQEYAKNNQLPNGSIVITDYQTHGKGTKDRKWLASKEKNIMMTIVLHPNTTVSKLDGLTINIAEAIKNVVYQLYGYILAIKQPNDLIINGKKIAGILTQSTTLNSQVTSLYIGIGFNVNEENFAPEIENIATSLKKEYGKELEREDLICKILENIEELLEEQIK